MLRHRGSQASPRTAAVREAALDLFASQGYRATTMQDIADRVGIRGPSLYKHVRSKQELLVMVIDHTMEGLLADQRAALRSSDDTVTQLIRVVEAHVRFHARHRREAFVGNRELDALEEPHRSRVVRQRRQYERGVRRVVEKGIAQGVFQARSAQLASYAIIDMGIGIATWFRPEGGVKEADLAYAYADMALRLVGIGPGPSPDAGEPGSGIAGVGSLASSGRTG